MYSWCSVQTSLRYQFDALEEKILNNAIEHLYTYYIA